MSVKQQLVEQVCKLLAEGAGVRIYGPASSTVTAADRSAALSKSVEFVENALVQLTQEKIRLAAVNSPEVQQAQEARRRDHEEFVRDTEWSKIFRTPLPGSKVAVDNQANRAAIEGWLHPHETLSQKVFLKAITETPRLIGQLVVTSSDSQDPKKQQQAAAAQAEEDRRTFSEAARKFGLSDNEANFRLVREVLGSGFTSYAIGQAVDFGAIRLAVASQAEQEAYRTEFQEQRQDWLVNKASPAELREAARSDSEQRHAQAQRQHVQEQVEARERAEANLGLPALPETTSDGQKIDCAYLLRLADTNIKQYKLLCNRFGFAAVTARINGVR